MQLVFFHGAAKWGWMCRLSQDNESIRGSQQRMALRCCPRIHADLISNALPFPPLPSHLQFPLLTQSTSAALFLHCRPTILINTNVMEWHTAYSTNNDVLFAMSHADDDACSTQFDVVFLPRVFKCRSPTAEGSALEFRCLWVVYLFL